MFRAASSWGAVGLLGLGLLAAVGTGCDQTDEDCWSVTGEMAPVTSDTLSTEHSNPRISPDGTRVAFTTDFWGTADFDNEARRDIGIIDMPAPGEMRLPVELLIDEGNARRVYYPFLPDDAGTSIQDFTKGVTAWPVWHPDGVRMAAVVNVPANINGFSDRLYVFELDFASADDEGIPTMNPVLIDDVDLASDPLNAQYQYATPAFSPDGQWLAYSRFFYKAASGTTPPVSVNPAIYAYNMNDGRVVRVTSGSSVEWEPAWSPSGTEIAFTSNRGNITAQTEIFKVAFDPANPAVAGQPDGAKRLTFTSVEPRPKIPVGSMQPTWMANGRIVFTSTQRPPCTSLRDRNIWSMTADGADQVVIFETRTDDQYASADPGGSNTIVFTTRINQSPDFENQKTDIWVLRDFTP